MSIKLPAAGWQLSLQFCHGLPGEVSLRFRIAAMMATRKLWFIIVTLVLVVTSLPYLYAACMARPDSVFGGFLLNPVDGNTYLAKMYEGWRGDIRFTLPYTAEPGEGAYLFLFYLFLGHLARWMGLPLVMTFHLARLLGTLFMLLALYRFFAVLLPLRWQSRWAFVLAALGSGMGWLALPFQGFTSDFWVAEAYPFLSAYATPHFSLGLGLLLGLLTCDGERITPQGIRGTLLFALGALALAIVSPFGVVIALVVLAGLLLWQAGFSKQSWTDLGRSLPCGLPGRFLAILFCGAPLLLYYFFVAHADSILAGWNAQNLTPSPPPWDLLLSFSPFLLLALPGAWLAIKQNRPQSRLLVTWAGFGLLLLYLPWGLQRRFIMGFFVPLVGLAVIGLESWTAGLSKRRLSMAVLLLILALPTNLLVLLAAKHGIQTLDPLLYLTRDEAQALVWVEKNTPPEALILAAPETGLFIPAHTGRRVIYGHPFETINAEVEEAVATQFFRQGAAAGGQLQPGFLVERGVDYVFFGPRERSLGSVPENSGLVLVYSFGRVSLWAVVQ